MTTPAVTTLGMIGLGRMGANMVRRLARGGVDCVAYDANAAAVRGLSGEPSARRVGAASATHDMRVELPYGVVDVWQLDLDAEAHDLHLLSAEEEARAERFRRPQDGRRRIR